MRRWWIEKGYLEVIQERAVDKDVPLGDIMNHIYEAAGAGHGF